MMASVRSYTIAVTDHRLQKLRAKLELAEFPDELDSVGWDYGAPLADVKRLTAYWRDRFEWRKQEEELNKLPNFQTEISVDGFEPLNVHFVHQMSQASTAIPLLFAHGCTHFKLNCVNENYLNASRARQLLGG